MLRQRIQPRHQPEQDDRHLQELQSPTPTCKNTIGWSAPGGWQGAHVEQASLPSLDASCRAGASTPIDAVAYQGRTSTPAPCRNYDDGARRHGMPAMAAGKTIMRRPIRASFTRLGHAST
jgi:hypothetical protein